MTKTLSDFKTESYELMDQLHARNVALRPRTRLGMKRERRWYRRRAFIQWLKYRIDLLLEKKAKADIEIIEHKIKRNVTKQN